jgi:hypothetical protein
MTESESMPPTRRQMQTMHQALNEKVLDKACSDPEWRQLLLEDPELAIREANFPELQELEQASAPEVQGQKSGGGWGGGWGGGFHHHHFGPGVGIAFVGGGYADDGCYVTRHVRTPYGYRLRTFNLCD